MESFGLHSKSVLVNGLLIEATIKIQNGKIEDLFPGLLQVRDFAIEDLGTLVIMPGIIDCHVHINEPGRTEWEGFDSATRAAAAGGITSLIEMPLNSDPVTTTAKAFNEKLAAAKGKIHVNCGFWGGIVPGNTDDLAPLIESGVWGIKAFLTHSGIDDFPNVGERDLRAGLPILKKYNVPLLVHAELDSPHSGQAALDENPSSYQAWLDSRPRSWEDEAIRLMINLCREFDTPVHIVHLSSSNSVTLLEEAKSGGMPISVETCPHYLFFDAEEIADGKTQYKCAPPIREKENNDKLWKALQEGLFRFVVSDHSPAPPEIKELDSGNFKKAWGGIASLQFSLPAFWTRAREREISIPQLSKLMSFNVAEFLGLEKSKGKIAQGYDADLTVWNPEGSFTVTKDLIHFRHKITPYEGYSLFGIVKMTYIGGHKVFDNGHFCELSKGKILKRNEAQ